MQPALPTPLSPIALWLLAIRPRTLPAAVVPVLVGTALAVQDGHFAAGPAIAALVGALLLQIAANFANDYFDFKQGADTPDRIGPTRVTAAGLVTPAQMQLATGLTLALALAIGVYLVIVGGWPIAVLGLASIACALAYTGGPYPLGYHGLGEVTVFVFFGLAAVMGTYYVQALAVTPLAAWLALPVGAWASAILVVNNLRDAPTDATCGKRTLAVRFGQPFARGLYLALVAIGFAVPAGLALAGPLGLFGWLPLLALPLAIKPSRAVLAPPEGPALNRALADTGKLLMVGGILLAVGVML